VPTTIFILFRLLNTCVFPDLVCPNIIFKVSRKHVLAFLYYRINNYFCTPVQSIPWQRSLEWALDLHVLRQNCSCPSWSLYLYVLSGLVAFVSLFIVDWNGQYIFMFSANLLFPVVSFVTLTWLNTRCSCFKRTWSSRLLGRFTIFILKANLSLSVVF